MNYFTFLRTFIAVYRCGSYNKASKKLGLTQPAISKQISSLEQQLNKKLFKRNGRGLKATVVADELASSLAHHVDSIELIFNQSRSISDDTTGTIHMGGSKEFINARMIPTFASLAQHSIKTVLQLHNPDKIYKLMSEGMLDLSITERVIEKTDIGYRHIFTTDLVLVSSRQWVERIRGNLITQQALSRIPLLVYKESFNYVRRYYIEVFNDDCLNRPIFIAEDLTIIHKLLHEGVGYSVLPKYLVEQDLASGELVQLFTPTKAPECALYLSWNKFSMRKAHTIFARDAILKAAEFW